jgi:DNA-binding NarL/FixJ family response regulator
MKPIIKIGLVDDHKLVLSSLERLIQSFDGYQVVLTAGNGQDMIEQFEKNQFYPEIILLDNNMPLMNGYETLLWLRKNHPTIRVLVLSMEDHENLMLKMIRAGANGYLLKDCHPDELKWALQEVLDKGYHYTKKVNGILKDAEAIDNHDTSHSFLKESELNFIKLSCSDMTYKEIADVMQLSPKTIDGYRQDVFHKLQVKNRVGLVLYAIKNKLIEL